MRIKVTSLGMGIFVGKIGTERAAKFVSSDKDAAKEKSYST